MLGIHHFQVFVLTGILLNLTPGSDTMYILARSISQGKKAGIYSVLGINAGVVVHTLMAAFGLSAIVAQSAMVFNLVKYAGAVYLLYLGVRALLAKSSEFQVKSLHDATTNRKIFTSGALTNILNPKVALFFLAFLPQFIEPSQAQNPIPYIVLGLTFITTGSIWCLILVLLASSLTSFFKKNNRVEYWLNKITGVVFIGLGVKMALQEK